MELERIFKTEMLAGLHNRREPHYSIKHTLMVATGAVWIGFVRPPGGMCRVTTETYHHVDGGAKGARGIPGGGESRGSCKIAQTRGNFKEISLRSISLGFAVHPLESPY